MTYEKRLQWGDGHLTYGQTALGTTPRAGIITAVVIPARSAARKMENNGGGKLGWGRILYKRWILKCFASSH
jgi:hypothetical protein